MKVAEVIRCDFCSEDMPFDETGIWCAVHIKGGHSKCGFDHFKKEHDEWYKLTSIYEDEA